MRARRRHLLPFLLLIFSLAATGWSAPRRLIISVQSIPGTGLASEEATGICQWLRSYLARSGVDSVLELDLPGGLELPQRLDLLNQLAPDWSLYVAAARPSGDLAGQTVLYAGAGTGAPLWPSEADAAADSVARALNRCLPDSGWVVTSDVRAGGPLALLQDLTGPGLLFLLPNPEGPDAEALWRCGAFQRLWALLVAEALLGAEDRGRTPSGAVAGIVRDADTALPVPNVPVELPAQHLRTRTDPSGSGFYAFFDVPPGSCRVEIRDPRFEFATRSLAVGSGGCTWADFELISAIPPTVLQVSPADSFGGTVGDTLTIRFSRPMDPGSVLRALRTEPAALWRARWSDGQRTLRLIPARHLAFGEQYALALSDRARDRYGHPLDGDADGVPGGDWSATFLVAPLGTATVRPIELVPVPGDTGIFPGQLLELTFSGLLDTASVEGVELVDAGGRRAPVSVMLARCRAGGTASSVVTRICLLPLIGFSPGEEYRVDFLSVPRDLAGNPATVPQNWHFRAATARRVRFTLEDFRPPTLQWNANPVPELPVDSVWFRVERGGGVGDSAYGRVQFLLTGDEGAFELVVRADSSREGVTLGRRDVMGVYAWAEGITAEAWALWQDADGRERSLPVPLPTSGWTSLFFTPEDSLLADRLGNGRADGDSVRFLGLGFRVAGNRTGGIRIDRLFALLSARPSGLSWASGAAEFRTRPRDFRLEKNRPNPFRSTTEIRFWIGRRLSGERARLEIVNLLGQTVAILWDGRATSGWYRVSWDGRDSAGADLPSGIYFARLNVGGQIAIQRLVLLR